MEYLIIVEFKIYIYQRGMPFMQKKAAFPIRGYRRFFFIS